MAFGNLSVQTTREAPSAPVRETAIAPKMLPVCCVCGLIRDETGSFLNRERWVTPRTYRKTHGTNIYCPTCFTRVMGTMSRFFRKSCRFSPIPETVLRRES